MPVREDTILRYVTAFCPHCHRDQPDQPLEQVRRCAGYLAEAVGRVWLVRGCPDHGRIVTLYDERPDILAYLERWTAPTKVHIPDTIGNFAPVPAGYAQGLGELQTQHTCILLEDITETCNLSCPTCFTDSSPRLAGVTSVHDVLANVDQRLARENGRLDVLMLSGGEPTLHPDLYQLVDRLLERDIVRLLINTNGITLARDHRLVAFLAERSERVELYLQFDGFRRDTHLHHRNADLSRIKQEAIERVSQAGIFTTLTMTAALGVNDDEIGAVVLHALDTPYIGGVTIQPQFGSGRSGRIDPLDRLTHTGVLARLGPQTDDTVTWQDLTALPCSHPHCASVGYLVRDEAGAWRSLTGILGHERLAQHLDLVSNRITDTELTGDVKRLVKAALLGLLSDRSSLTHPDTADLFRDVCEACDLGLSTLTRWAVTGRVNRRALRDEFARRVKRVQVRPFMGIDTMLEERLLQCCVHVGTRSETQDQCAPFCAVQAWAPLSRMRLSESAGRGRSLPLVPTGGVS